MKDPAFLFYPNDWLGGTMGMTFEQKGAYMELLMLQFNRGHMTKHMIGQVLGQTSGQIWEVLQDKFDQDENGLFFNRRLEEEQSKRKAYSDSRRNNIGGKNQYSKTTKSDVASEGHMDGHMTSHMENENINENINKDIDENNIKEKRKIFKKPSMDEVTVYCQERKNSISPEQFINYYEANGWKVGRNQMKDWKAAIRTWENNGYSNTNKNGTKTGNATTGFSRPGYDPNNGIGNNGELLSSKKRPVIF